MKPQLTEHKAVIMVMDAIFKQSDLRWPELSGPLFKLLADSGMRATRPDYVKFHLSIASLAINMRSLFDLFPRARAVRIFDEHLEILKTFFPDPAQYKAVENTLGKYIEAYNEGIYKIHNPVQDVAMYMYYKIGLENTQQEVVDEKFYAPEPDIQEYLCNALMMFTGKWEFMLERFELQGESGSATLEGQTPQE